MPIRSRGQMNRDYLYHWLQERKKMSIKSSSKHTKRQPYWFSKCSGIPFGWRGDVCGVPGSKTNGQWQQIVHKVPFQVYAVAFSLLFCSCSSEMLPKPQAQTKITSNYLCWRETNKRRQQMTTTKKDSRQN